MVYCVWRGGGAPSMNVWSKALALTASCLSPLYGIESRLGQVRKLTVALGCDVVFAGFSGFLHQLKLASHGLAAIWQKK